MPRAFLVGERDARAINVGRWTRVIGVHDLCGRYESDERD
jgi:hypothetical protein